MAIKRINDQLKALLPPETLKALEDAFAKADVVIETTDGYIPKERFDAVNNDLKDYKGKYDATVAEMDKFRSAAKGNEELTAILEKTKAEHSAEKQRYEKMLTDRERDYLLRDALKEARAKNPKAVNALLEHEKIVLKDGKLEGLDAQLEALRKSDSFLFDENPNPKPASAGRTTIPPFNGSGKTGSVTDGLDPKIAAAFGIKTEQK